MRDFSTVSLWFASLWYGLGDGVTTALLLIDPELVESNPAVLALLDVGGFALFALAKLLVITIAIALIALADRVEVEHVETVPVAFSVTVGLMGLYATAHNIGLLF